LGFNVGGSGTYTLSKGSLALSLEFVGLDGSGTFNQSGGSALTASLIVAYDRGSRGKVNLSGGVMTANDETLADDDNAVATFNHSGGTNNILANLSIGSYAIGALGTYSMSSGATLIIGESAYVGDFGSGALNQTGGAIAINGANPLSGLSIGDRYGASGTVNLSAGTLSVVGATRVGSEGAGTFNQSGGVHTANALYIAYGRNGTNL